MAVEVLSPITGNVWKIVKKVGEQVEEYEAIMIMESMKMEIPVEAPQDGKILEIKVKEGDSVIEEDIVALLE
ncbi:MAG: acetyl-CoA carboxylase biotin carboxyl carrier protein subunit [Firmicutes bacterium ML8_F2]|jgi:acetyl-CoA carboxylase biotin carboxyl carrier protein|nr:MAG: acetyl-CoA carboxylase biotin carboxyl carrier protein subunit [Firmicutes bacterium ML8_F2]